jgi:hypothetical protein
MKRIFTIAAALFMTASVWAQSPEKMSYQAVVRNGSNALLTTQPVGMQISILQGGATGTAVYVETQTPTTNANGLVSLEIGSGTVVSGDFTTIDWANDTYFIKTETDPTGGTTYTITGTSQLMSVPYALHANTADSVTNDQVNDADADPTNEIQNVSDVLIAGNDAGANDLVNLGQLAVGTSTPSASAAIEVNSTSSAILLSRMSTAQRDAIATPEVGMIIFNTDSEKFQGLASNTPPSNIFYEENTNAPLCLGGAGQDFTASVSFTWTVLAIESCSGAQTGTINFYDGSGTGGTLLLSQPVSLVAGVNLIVLSTPISCTSGNMYTFSTNMGLSYSFGGDPYPGGVSYSGGAPFVADRDMYFRVGESTAGVTVWVDFH